MNTLVLTLSLAFLVIAPSTAIRLNKFLPKETEQQANEFKTSILGTVEEMCVHVTGSPNAFNKIKLSVNQAEGCIEKLINSTMLDLAGHLASIDGRDPTVEELKTITRISCSKTSNLYSCVDPVFANLDPCLNPELVTKKDLAVKIFKRLIKEVCVNDGAKAIEFTREHGEKCAISKKDKLTECAENVIGQKYKTKPFEIPSTKEQCHDLDELKTCAVNKLNECKEKAAVHFLAPLMSAIKDEICSSANSIGTPNLSLMLLGSMLMAFFLSKF